MGEARARPAPPGRLESGGGALRPPSPTARDAFRAKWRPEGAGLGLGRAVSSSALSVLSWGRGLWPLPSTALWGWRRAEGWPSRRPRPVPPSRKGREGNQQPVGSRVSCDSAASRPHDPAAWSSRRLPFSAPPATPGSPRWRRRCKQA